MNDARLVQPRMTGIFTMLVACFALWGVLNNMTDNLVPAFQKIFTMDQSRAGLVQVAFYGAYAVLALFASVLVEEFSYRKGVLVGLGIYIAGALMYIPACLMHSFDLYFMAIFVVASGCSLLETSCNPYVLSLGDESTAVRRLNFAQMFNPVGSIAGIFLAKELILAKLHPSTAAERALMDEATLGAIVDKELFWVCVPYVGLCAIAVVIWLFFLVGARRHDAADGNAGVGRPALGPRLARTAVAALCAVAPLAVLYALFPQMNKIVWILCGMTGPLACVAIVPSYRAMLVTLLRTPRYWCGVVAQFFYIGVQIAAWTWMNAYCQKELGVEKDVAANYYLIAIVLFVACRWTTTALMKRFNPASMMALFASGAIAACAGVMYLPSTVLFGVAGLKFSGNVLCLVAMSGCMSLMFPTIYGIALGGLDARAVKLGAAGLIMAILGGAVITPWMADVIGDPESVFAALVPCADATWDGNLRLSSATLRASFAIPAICFAAVLAYALAFRPRRRDGE